VRVDLGTKATHEKGNNVGIRCGRVGQEKKGECVSGGIRELLKDKLQATSSEMETKGGRGAKAKGKSGGKVKVNSMELACRVKRVLFQHGRSVRGVDGGKEVQRERKGSANKREGEDRLDPH